MPNNKSKSRKTKGRFLMLTYEVTNCDAFKSLSAYAVKLLIDMCQQYNGINNGDFTATWTYMKKRGWRSRETLNNKIKELIDAGFIEKTRQGGKHQCSLYAMTWEAIDECKGKLDTKETRVASKLWKNCNTIVDKSSSTNGSLDQK